MEAPHNSLIDSMLALPPSERADLALQLLQSLNYPGDEVPEEQLGRELHERVEKHRRGEISSCELDEARNSIRNQLFGGERH